MLQDPFPVMYAPGQAPTHSFYAQEDLLLAAQLPGAAFLAQNIEELTAANTSVCDVYVPDERLAFLHEAAIIEFKGVLYASWYNCPQKELTGYTPICGKRSYDGGRTWSGLEVIAEDKTEQILYCPPVYGIDNGRLYMLMNQMVSADHMHALDLYVLNEETQEFEFCWSRPIPFKLNTNVVALPNGKLLLPGRVAEPDGFPNTPAVLISDSGHIDAPWRLVYIAPDGKLGNGRELVHPELTVLCAHGTLYMFCRNDNSRIPLVYLSYDMGESWTPAHAHDIPYVSSKIYAGTLRSVRHYLIANIDKFDRSRLAVYFTDGPDLHFTKKLVLFDDDRISWGACHYPAACEAESRLHIIATRGYEAGARGALLFTVDLAQI